MRIAALASPLALLACATPVPLTCIEEDQFDLQWAALNCEAAWQCQTTWYASEADCVRGTLESWLPERKRHMQDVCPNAAYDACEAAACLDEIQHSPEECGPSPYFGTCSDMDWYVGACSYYFGTE